ncbi:MAG: isoleucine--tRNA ligase [Patescibacteria group bacterium]
MDFAESEKKILKFWKDNDIFKKSLRHAQGKLEKEFVFYDGPPFATGLPHYGHIVASLIKDVVPRYWTMKGYKVERKWGWDTHGLPIENIVEKELGSKSKKEIEEMGIEKFNEMCRSKVLVYADEWKKYIERLGRWVDMESDYKTMDTDFMESVWWVFKQLWDKGYIYKDYRSMHVCPRCETTLSQSEVAEGYKDVKDISVTVKFELEDEPGTFVLAWTTTPWTLPGNVALAVGKDVMYVRAKNKKTGKNIILSKRAFANFSDQVSDYEVFGNKMKGEELISKKYKPLFNYYSSDTELENKENGWKIYGADFVNTEEGTGVVHIAPAFGEDDMNLGKEKNLPFVQHVGMDGNFKEEVKDFAGTNVKPIDNPLSTDIEILKFLNEKGLVFSKEKYEHSYPHCWRCDSPLINYATSSWFVAVEKMKENLLENAKDINWSPEHIKEGRFGKWLEGARDWSISRQRFWASVIPIWECECGKRKVIGSVAELEELSGQKVSDLHKHVVDEIIFDCSCGKKMKRIPDVFDCWFESGSMPYAQMHYPFENKEKFEENFPAEFIAEGVDQTRAWFYYLHVLATGIFDKKAFGNVIVNGIVLAEDGKKMSKKLQNYPDPMEIFDKYGADSLRYYLLSSPVVRAENLNFSEKGVDEVAKKIVSKIRNVLSFYEMYAREAKEDHKSSDDVLDRWIVARLNEVKKEVTESMDNYELDKATRPIGDFIDDLSNWYIRRSRDRFKTKNEDADFAIATTRYVLEEFSKLIAPFTPFVAEEVFQMVSLSNTESVHLEKWLESGEVDQELLTAMSFVRSFATMALMQRAEGNIRVRQPLQKLSVKHSGEAFPYWDEVKYLLADEINVKEVVFEDGVSLEESGVELDTNITSELKEEGQVRELTRAIQGHRKKLGLKPGEEAKIKIQTSSEGQEFVNKHKSVLKDLNIKDLEFTEEKEENVLSYIYE